jgi:catechol 2,3-dioxygenase-like lactoylglutathione lyase family enzyme
MPVQFNHTIIKVRHKAEAAKFFAETLGLGPVTSYGPFLCLETANGVSLDFADTEGEPSPIHYAYLVEEDDFDGIHARLREQSVDYWADPFLREPGEINHNDGGRGVYWLDPNGHVLEAITRPYGS